VFVAAWTGCSARAYRHRCDHPVRRAARSAADGPNDPREWVSTRSRFDSFSRIVRSVRGPGCRRATRRT